MTNAQILRQAIDAMRTDHDTRWHAVADLLAGAPLSYARNPACASYSAVVDGVKVARAYLDHLTEGN